MEVQSGKTLSLEINIYYTRFVMDRE